MIQQAPADWPFLPFGVNFQVRTEERRANSAARATRRIVREIPMAAQLASRYDPPPAKEGWDMSRDARRLIEDYLPIEDVSKESSREKSLRKGHISTLHLWWARRPLVACRAAIYGALVPIGAFQAKATVHNPPADPQELASIEEALARIYRRGWRGSSSRNSASIRATRARSKRPGRTSWRRTPPSCPPRTTWKFPLRTFSKAMLRGRACWTCLRAAVRSRWRLFASDARLTPST